MLFVAHEGGQGVLPPPLQTENDTSSALLFLHAVIVKPLGQHEQCRRRSVGQLGRRLVAGRGGTGIVNHHPARRWPHCDLLFFLIIGRIDNGHGVVRAVGHDDILCFASSLRQYIQAVATSRHKGDLPKKRQHRRCRTERR